MPHTRVNEQHLLHKEWDCCDITSAGGHYGVHVSTTSIQIPWCIGINMAYIFEASVDFYVIRWSWNIIIQTTTCGKVGLPTPRRSRLSRGPLSPQVETLGNKVKRQTILFWAAWTSPTNISYTTPHYFPKYGPNVTNKRKSWSSSPENPNTRVARAPSIAPHQAASVRLW